MCISLHPSVTDFEEECIRKCVRSFESWCHYESQGGTQTGTTPRPPPPNFGRRGNLATVEYSAETIHVMVLDYPSSSDQSPVTSVVNTPTKRTAPSPPTSPSSRSQQSSIPGEGSAFRNHTIPRGRARNLFSDFVASLLSLPVP